MLIWLLIAILVVPQGLDFQGINGIPTSSDMLSRVTWLVLLGSGLYLVGRNLGRARTFARNMNPFLWMFLGLAAASWLWSIEPSITLRRVLRVVTIFLVCMSFATLGWQPKRYQELMRSVLTWLCGISIVFVILVPDQAIHFQKNAELNGAWHGITIGKNVLGSLASSCAILWLHGWMSKEVRPTKAAAGIAIAVICLAGTRSATSILATVFALGFMLILLRSPGTLRRYMPYLVGIFASIVLLYCVAVLRLVPGLDIILSPITALTGKDLTFTGRTAIWEILNEHIRLNPWFGSGYGAYWKGPDPSSPSFVMLTRLYFYPTEGHNGYLDVINDLGAVGGFVLLGYFITYIRRALTLMKTNRHLGGLFLTLIFRGFIADMSESHWFISLSIDFALMTIATMALDRSLQLSTEQAPAQPARSTTPRPARARSLSG